jgi:hypothetical protein
MASGFNPSWVKLFPPRSIWKGAVMPPFIPVQVSGKSIWDRVMPRQSVGGPRVVVTLHPPQTSGVFYQEPTVDRSMVMEDLIAPSLQFPLPTPPAARQHPTNNPPVPSIRVGLVAKPAMQAPSRIGGKRVTPWPPQAVSWPEYGNPTNAFNQ